MFSEKSSTLTKIPDIGLRGIKALKNADAFRKSERELKFIEQNNIQILYYENDNFPRRLTHCPDHPIVLFSKGKMNPNKPKVVSIVGTRRATNYGKELTQKIIEDLQSNDIVISSGLAFGIDAQAHQCSVQNQVQTIGVVAHGLDRIYPREHGALAESMLSNGGLISEFTSGTIPNKENFPRRNRIVAGMADATIVIESKARGGALITAFQASGYNRDVFAVPGKVGDIASEGCNLLIKKNIAGLITGGQDIIEAMGWTQTPKQTQMTLFTDLSENEKLVYDTIAAEKVIHRDELTAGTPISSSEVAGVLLSLELKGAIKSQPGGKYSM